MLNTLRAYIICSISLILILSAELHSEENVNYGKTEQQSYSISREITEWSIFTALFGGSILINEHGPFFSKPLIGGPTDRNYRKKDTVPVTWLHYWTGGTFTFIAFSPNNSGYFNAVTYNNVKGFYEAASYSYFLTALTKSTFGRKRPSYDNYPEQEKNNSGRKSFISGHSSEAFVTATYGSLFIYEHIGGNSGKGELILKSSAIAVLYSAAVYTAWSRVDDNRHHKSDVIAGSAVGIFSALAGYMHQNGWLNSLRISDSAIIPEITPDNIYISIVKKM